MAQISPTLREIWVKYSKDPRLLHRARWSVDAITKEAKKRNSRRRIPQLTNWIAILDEHISWLIQATIPLSDVLEEGKESNSDTSSYMLVLGSCVNLALAIRTLCLEGHDAAAKQVLRSLREYADLLLLFEIEPSVIAEFKETEDIDAANRFWFKHLSKGKAQRKIEKHFYDVSSEKDAEEMTLAEWRTEERKVVDAVAHPSRVASFLCYTSLASKNILPMVGSKSTASVRTLRVATLCLFDIALYCKSLRFWEEAIPSRFLAFDADNKMHLQLQDAWLVLMAVGMFATVQGESSLLQVAE